MPNDIIIKISILNKPEENLLVKKTNINNFINSNNDKDNSIFFL